MLLVSVIIAWLSVIQYCDCCCNIMLAKCNIMLARCPADPTTQNTNSVLNNKKNDT